MEILKVKEMLECRKVQRGRLAPSRQIAGMLMLLSMVLISGCGDKQAEPPQEEEASKPVVKKLLFTQRTQGGKNSINVIEETEGYKRTLRIVLQRGDLSSNLIHPIDSPNFVIAVPLQDATSKQFSLQTVAYELRLKEHIDQLLARYLAPERYNVSVVVSWDEKLLQEVQLKSLPLDTPVTDLPFPKMPDTQTSEEGEAGTEGTAGSLPVTLEEPTPTQRARSVDPDSNYELKHAVVSLKVQVLLDNTLPGSQEQFIQQLIPVQEFYDTQRGDAVTVERTSFPKPFSDSVAPYEEQIVTRKLTELVQKYVSPNEFVVNVKFTLIDAESAMESTSNIKMNIDLLLDEVVLPDVDTFLQEAIPLAVNFNAERGDTLNIIRKRFPERNFGSVSSEQVAALRDYKDKILEAFQTGDYVGGLEWADKGLRIAVRRMDKVFLMKMKGSLHFLLEEKDKALEVWQHVQRLDPADEEVRQMLENLQ
ncbi:MAG: hypothetical protein CL923_01695 [Deltaproteobacteria bacterium]|nr:hypothetical protein [Deltaproteobacteria bacterium]